MQCRGDFRVVQCRAVSCIVVKGGAVQCRVVYNILHDIMAYYLACIGL